MISSCIRNCGTSGEQRMRDKIIHSLKHFTDSLTLPLWNRNVPSLSLLYSQSNICTCFPSLTHNSHWSTEVQRVTSFCNPLGFHPVVAVTNYSSSVTSLSIYIYIFFQYIRCQQLQTQELSLDKIDFWVAYFQLPILVILLASGQTEVTFQDYISINVGALIKPEFETKRQGNLSSCSKTSAI